MTIDAIEKISEPEKTVDLFNSIGQSALLTQEDFDSLKEMAEELQDTFVKTQVFRTRTEMEVSVLNDLKFPTSSLKYWQSMREQNVMFTELVSLSYDYRRNLIEIQILERDIVNEDDDLKRALLKVDLDQKIFRSKEQERVAKARARELKAWSEIKVREAQQMTPADLADVDNSQLIGYTKRWIKQSIAMGGGGSPPERQNLLGQLRSGIQCCIEKGVIGEVLDGFGPQIIKQIRKEYGL
jgi:hypothetical protein